MEDDLFLIRINIYPINPCFIREAVIQGIAAFIRRNSLRPKLNGQFIVILPATAEPGFNRYLLTMGNYPGYRVISHIRHKDTIAPKTADIFIGKIA